MRKYETRPVPATTQQVLVETTCDICGKVAKRGNWDSATFEVNETELEVTVKQRDGKNYPEGGWGTEVSVDLCPPCFKDKLIPWLESQVAKIERKEWDW